MKNKANSVLEMFGYKTNITFPINPEDSFFYEKIFGCIEEYILNKGVNNEDIFEAIKNIDDICIKKHFDNFPIYEIETNKKHFGAANIQICKSYMIAVCEMVLKDISTEQRKESCDKNVSEATIENKIHIFAEAYRGLYSVEIDNLIDEINKLVQERDVFDNNMNEELILEELKKYYNLSKNIDKKFKEIQQKIK